jgi:dienelactone hydrolase
VYDPRVAFPTQNAMTFRPGARLGRYDLVVQILLLGAFFSAPAVSQPGPRFELSGSSVLVDETVEIRLSGLPSGRPVTVRLQQHDTAGLWRSHATFVADGGGRIDLARMAPVSGSYSGVAPMGLVWSLQRDPAVERREATRAASPAPVQAELTAEIDGTVGARVIVRRHALAADVRVTEVRDRGLVGVFYEPPGQGRHPAMLVFGGSEGGLVDAWSYPGGLSSRGYAVLALAYFGVEGLPPKHSMIPLEYFKTALDWLSEHPAVDARRIGIFGSSRGGELALLLGATYPQIATVVAHVPSHVVWAGCCDSLADPAWTLGGKPIQRVVTVPTPEAVARHANGQAPQSVHQFLALLDDASAVARGIIPVERINAPVLLISGRDDRMWPSTYMADQVVARFRQHGFRHPVTHLAYDDAGHALGRPHFYTVNRLGGTTEGNGRARAEHWESMLRFLETNLRSAPQPKN